MSSRSSIEVVDHPLDRFYTTDKAACSPMELASDSIFPVYLHDLPSEVLSLIFSYVKRPSDLKTLMTMCKRFHLICLPYLYQKVILDRYEYRQDPFFHRKFNSLISEKNPGSRYIRHVFVGTPTWWIPNAQLDYIVDSILEAVPANTLRSIGFLNKCGGNCRCNIISNKNVARIIQHQQNIQEICLDSTRLQDNNSEILDYALKVKLLRSLRLCLHNFNLGPVHALVSRLAKANPNLDHLTVCLGEQNRTETTDIRLKSHFWNFGLECPVQLRSLSFINYDFNSFDISRFTSSFVLEKLESLELSGCVAPEVFLHKLMEHPEMTEHLRSFKFRHFCYFPGSTRGRTIFETSLETFLSGLRHGLTSLYIVLDRPKALPTVSVFSETVHAATLQKLLVVARNRYGTPNGTSSLGHRTSDLWPLRYSIDELQAIGRACLQLRQLSISLPMESGPDWCLEMCAPLKHLKTFVDVPWLGFDPHPQGSTDNLRVAEPSPEEEVKVKPEMILPAARRVFGVMDRVDVPLQVYGTGRIHQARAKFFYFMRVKQERDRATAWSEPMLVTRDELGYVIEDEDCDIVDFTHHFRGESGTATF